MTDDISFLSLFYGDHHFNRRERASSLLSCLLRVSCLPSGFFLGLLASCSSGVSLARLVSSGFVWLAACVSFRPGVSCFLPVPPLMWVGSGCWRRTDGSCCGRLLLVSGVSWGRKASPSGGGDLLVFLTGLASRRRLTHPSLFRLVTPKMHPR